MPPLARKSYKAALYFFAIVGLVDLCGRILLAPLLGEIYGFAVGLPLGVEIVRVVPSEDKSLKAILYSWSGSALDAGCEEWISVVQGSASNERSAGVENQVFARACVDGDEANVGWEPPAAGRVKPRLRINLDPSKAYRMSRFALGGRVSVAYQNDP